jgi:probable addiction module antidote protein
MRKTTRFDAADYLDTEERQVAYITAALETGDADFVRDALGLVARARGMGQIAKNAGLGLTLSARPASTGRTTKRRRVA